VHELAGCHVWRDHASLVLGLKVRQRKAASQNTITALHTVLPHFGGDLTSNIGLAQRNRTIEAVRR